MVCATAIRLATGQWALSPVWRTLAVRCCCCQASTFRVYPICLRMRSANPARLEASTNVSHLDKENTASGTQEVVR